MAGIVQIEIIDGGGTPTGRAIQMWSSDGTINGDLYPLQVIVGNDGINPSGPANPLQVLGNLTLSGNSTVAGEGTAGTPTGGLLTIQGVASMTPVQVGDNAGSVTVDTSTPGNFAITVVPANMTVVDQATVAQGSTTSGEKGSLIQGAVTTAAPSYSTAQTSPISLDTSGNTRVVDATVAAAITAAALTPSQIRLLGTAIVGDSGNVGNASAVATLAAAAGKTTYLNDFVVTAGGATAASVVTVAVTGLLGGTKHFTFGFPTGAGVAAQPLVFAPPQPLPASAANTTIVVTVPAGGTGNTNATVTADGFQL